MKTWKSDAMGERSSRKVALEILTRVEEGAAYSNILLQKAGEHLDEEERGLISELVLGTLRHRLRVDRALGHFLHYPLESLPPLIRSILRLGAYQLLFLSRIPKAVAVSTSVELAKQVGHAGTASLVNAVLRRLGTEGEPPLPREEEDPAGYLSIAYSHPSWLVRRWVERFGWEGARALCEANNQVPPTCLRVNSLRATREEVLSRLREAGVHVEPSPFLVEAVRIHGGPVEERQRLFEEGLVSFQDEGAMAVVHALNPSPGWVVIDACAAPGGKTTHIGEWMRNQGRILALDIHPGKLQALSRHCARLGIEIVEAHHLDARETGKRFPGIADGVLVDAPCSGLGVVRRRPEVKWRVQPEDLQELQKLQVELLGGVADALKPGGVLVYSVCTLEREETEEVIQIFLRRFPRFSPTDLTPYLPFPLQDGQREMARQGMAFLYPHIHGTDGFFIARMVLS
ncbi:MAG: 16S rRNA (cytosine(967)-C(5))-methyltransferase RsmB [Armatimonadota bacterium]|nr:16S rRNA (cytosine(967)-C(5))-methyltransferase RsmB [Armatimonadota bacterium]